jgi:hypothetical protein
MSERHDYLEDVADADEMIAEFGQAGTLRRQTATGPDYNPTVITIDHACIFAVLDYANREVDGSRILASDKKVLLARGDLDIVPTLSDELLVGGAAHSILDVQPLAPAGIVVLWTIQIRK